MIKIKRTPFIISILLIFCLSFLTACSNNNKASNSTDKIEKSDTLMGTVIKVSIYDSTDETILNKVFDKIKELEATLSINENGTLIDKINESAGISPVEVDDDTYYLLEKCIEYSKLSNGLFDISIGPIVKLWSIGLPGAKVPTQEEIDEKLPLVGYENIEFDDANKTIFLKKKGMVIDLGGIAKGYTADVISDILTEENVDSAIINLGGNVYAHGKKFTGEDWKIGIQNPFDTRGKIVGIITVSNKSVVTSGIYERYIEEADGTRYHHILSPVTGYPYENEIAGITIVSDKSIDGDALSTSVFAMGLEDGMNFVNSMENIEAIFITKNKEVFITDGLKDIFSLSNTEFTLEN